MHLAAPVGQAIELVALSLQTPEQVAHAVYLLRHQFRIALYEEAYLLLVFLVFVHYVLHDFVKRTFLTVEEELKPFVIYHRCKSLTPLSVGDILREKRHEVVIHQHFPKIEYQILNHAAKVVKICQSSKLKGSFS